MLSLFSMSEFKQKVLEVVAAIPKGGTLTYKEVALRAGSPRAFRVVGSIMSKNYDVKVPCHRVIKSNGTLGDYNRGGQSRKQELLLSEGALI